MHRSYIRKDVEQYRMPRFMICSNALLLIRDNLTFLLRTDSYFYKGLPYITLYNICPSCLCRLDSRLIHQIFQISARKSRRGSCDFFQIHIISQWFSGHMNLQDFFPPFHIRLSDTNLAVKTSRTHNRRIQDIYPVRSRHHDDSLIHAKAVHLY